MKRPLTIILMSLALFLLGCDATNTRTYDEGYEEGSKAGYEDGHEDGSATGYSEGYEEGYTTGYEEGYSEGYNDGYSDGEIVELSEPESPSYVGNKSTMKFHKSTCSSVLDIKESNKVFESRDYFVKNGYKPCGKCNP